MKEKILALLKSLGIVKDEDVAKVTSELDKLQLDATPPVPIDTSKIQNEDMKKLVDSFQSQLNSVMEVNKQLTASLAAEKAARDAAIAAQETNQKSEKEKKITAAVDAAIKEGKFPEAKRDHLKKLFESDFDSATEIVKDTPVNKLFKPTKEKNENDNNNNNNNDVVIKSALDTGSSLLGKVREFANLNEN